MFVSPSHESGKLLNDMPLFRVADGFTGLLSLHGGLLVASHRPAGRIWVVDVTDLENPRLLAKAETNASPYEAKFDGDRILIPGGRLGLLELKLH